MASILFLQVLHLKVAHSENGMFHFEGINTTVKTTSPATHLRADCGFGQLHVQCSFKKWKLKCP